MEWAHPGGRIIWRVSVDRNRVWDDDPEAPITYPFCLGVLDDNTCNPRLQEGGMTRQLTEDGKMGTEADLQS